MYLWYYLVLSCYLCCVYYTDSVCVSHPDGMYTGVGGIEAEAVMLG